MHEQNLIQIIKHINILVLHFHRKYILINNITTLTNNMIIDIRIAPSSNQLLLDIRGLRTICMSVHTFAFPKHLVVEHLL